MAVYKSDMQIHGRLYRGDRVVVAVVLVGACLVLAQHGLCSQVLADLRLVKCAASVRHRLGN